MREYPAPMTKPGREPGVTLLCCGSGDGKLLLLLERGASSAVLRSPSNDQGVYVPAEDGVLALSKRPGDIFGHGRDSNERHSRIQRFYGGEWVRRLRGFSVEIEFPEGRLEPSPEATWPGPIKVRCIRCGGVTLVEWPFLVQLLGGLTEAGGTR